MRHSLHSHIIYLENTIQELRNRLTVSDQSVDEAQDIELQLALAESALKHYQQAYALELSVAGSDGSNSPAGPTTSGGNGGPESRNSEKKPHGELVLFPVRARKRAANARPQLRERLTPMRQEWGMRRNRAAIGL